MRGIAVWGNAAGIAKDLKVMRRGEGRGRQLGGRGSSGWDSSIRRRMNSSVVPFPVCL